METTLFLIKQTLQEGISNHADKIGQPVWLLLGKKDRELLAWLLKVSFIVLLIFHLVDVNGLKIYLISLWWVDLWTK